MRIYSAVVIVALVSCGGTARLPPADAGRDTPDAGETPTDAGEMPTDGGEFSDAGVMPVDAGVCTVSPVTITHDGPGPGPNIVHFLDGARYPNAVCNDGTPAAFFIRRGSGDAARRWVIYLEGGGSCIVAEGCANRSLEFSSTSGINRGDGQTITLRQGGVASLDEATNPDFFDATVVQLNYCSSDLWSGDLGATPGAPTTDLRHWHFRGKRIVRSVIAELIRSHGLGTAREVFFMGSSAGGAGTLANIDETREALPSSVRFLGLIDGIYSAEYRPYDPATGLESTTLPPTTGASPEERFAAWGAEGDESCTAKYGAFHPTCNVVSRLLATNEIESPLFIVDSQMDSNQLGDLGLRGETPSEVAFAERYAAAKRQTFPNVQARFGLFSAMASQHVLVNTLKWQQQTVGGFTLRDSVGDWYKDPCNAVPRLVDSP